MADSGKGSGHTRLAFWDLLTDVGVIAVLKKTMEEKGTKALGGTLPTEDEALWQRVLMRLHSLTDANGVDLHNRAKQMFALLNGVGERAFFLHMMQADYHRLVELYKTMTEKKDPLDELTNYVRQLLEAYPDPQAAANHVRETRGAVAHWISKVPEWGKKLLDRLGLSEALSTDEAQQLGAVVAQVTSGGGIDELTAAIAADADRRRDARRAREADPPDDDEGDGGSNDGPNRPRRRRRRSGGVWFAIIFLVVAAIAAYYASTHDAQHLMNGPTPTWQKAAEDAATSAAGVEAATGGSTRHWYNDSMFWLFALMGLLIIAVMTLAIVVARRSARRSNGPDRENDHRYGAARTVASDVTTTNTTRD